MRALFIRALGQPFVASLPLQRHKRHAVGETVCRVNIGWIFAPDLYGCANMLLATTQAQQQQIKDLQKKVADLKPPVSQKSNAHLQKPSSPMRCVAHRETPILMRSPLSLCASNAARRSGPLGKVSRSDRTRARGGGERRKTTPPAGDDQL
jgi:hypothetical protein